MAQEDKELLLKDLCSRLQYRTVISKSGNWQKPDYCLLDIFIIAQIMAEDEIVIRPYLRPISSMTDEEMDKLFDILHIDKNGNDEDWIKINDDLGIKFFFPNGKWIENVAESYDYLNSIHIDYRGLINKGLALVAPEWMYKVD